VLDREVGSTQIKEETVSLRINQNAAAFNAYRNLSVNDSQMSKSLEKLSSGFRINRAADDASGLVKSESLRAEIRGTQQAVRNAQDGVSFVQTAEGALNEVHSILQRMRELAVDASNTATTNGAPQQAEVAALKSELDSIGSNTKFAGQTVFSASAVTFQTGANSGQAIGVTVGALSSSSIGSSATSLASVDVSAAGGASSAIGTIDTAIASLSTQRAALGAVQNRMEHTINSLNVAVENLSASESRIRDTDMAQEMTSFTRSQILVQAGTAMLAQANAAPQAVLKLLQ
jgi:flagellin